MLDAWSRQALRFLSVMASVLQIILLFMTWWSDVLKWHCLFWVVHFVNVHFWLSPLGFISYFSLLAGFQIYFEIVLCLVQFFIHLTFCFWIKKNSIHGSTRFVRTQGELRFFWVRYNRVNIYVSMLWKEGTKKKGETKTILNIELLFAKVDLMRTGTRGKKTLLQSLWWSYLWLKSSQSKKEQTTTNLI